MIQQKKMNLKMKLKDSGMSLSIILEECGLLSKTQIKIIQSSMMKIK